MKFNFKRHIRLLDSMTDDEIREKWPSSFSKAGRDHIYCVKFYMQMDEIDRLRKNQERLEKICANPNVSFRTKSNIELFSDLLYTALMRYEKGMDAINPSFDHDVFVLNNFVESHIVTLGGHKTFRRYVKADKKLSGTNPDGTPKTPIQIRNENVKTFERMQKKFLSIGSKIEKS